ncbi:putative MFS family arabinose efflux permease [Chitinophaga terrae (ex Kim and Jung 2007)]|uniref:MFS transporter n=1 Tax=Chitinophaga terrae (ex Kim and Jung 2007) TaxID=408074 RepID=UPI002788B476|nr:MFS transporter [Chitinophaga terrae (ex Kim and Jung 2007)]MDQ0109320.1 putative MFS family arabinose efflux permease [Chitinophaga terrae (ex Kim and Jung 2007)]
MGLSRWNIIIMALCTGLIVANIYYSQPLTVLISQEFRVSESNAGQVTFFTQVGYALGLLFCVPLGDKLERKKQIIGMTLAAAISLVGAALAKNMAMLKFTGLLIGFTSVVPQLILPMAAHLSDPASRGRVIGTIMSGLLVGILLSRTLSGVVGHHLGWRAMFWIAAGISGLLAGIMTVSFPSSKPNFQGSYSDLMGSLITLIKEQPMLREASAINACCFAMFGMFWTTVVFLLSDAPFHYTSEQIGLMGLAAAAGALGAPLIGRVADKKNPRIAIGYGIIFLFAGYILFYFFRANIIGIIVGIIAIDLGLQGIHVSNQTRIYTMMPEARNRLNTVFMTASFIGTSLGSGIGLWVWSVDQWTGVCIAGLALITMALVIYLSTYKKPVAA